MHCLTVLIAGEDFQPETFPKVQFPSFESDSATFSISVMIVDDDVVESVESLGLVATTTLPSDNGRDVTVSSNMLFISIMDNADSKWPGVKFLWVAKKKRHLK